VKDVKIILTEVKINWKLWNYVIIMLIAKCSIKFNNIYLNSLQRNDRPIAHNYRILHRVVQILSQHNLKMSQDLKN
jgi:hypothetical protein